MNIQYALVPHKHIKFCDSLLALAGYLRPFLENPHTIDELWSFVNKDKSDLNFRPTFNSLVSAVVILYAIGQVEATPEGRIQAIIS